VVGGAGITVTKAGGTYTISSAAMSGPSSSVNNSVALFDGITGNALKSSRVIISDGGTVEIATAANTNSRGFDITQTSPASGLAAGPIDFNKIHIVNQGGASFSGGDPFRTDEARGLHVHMEVGGANLKGYQNAARFRLDHTIADSNIAFGDHIGVVAIAYSNKDAAGHGLYGLNTLAWADTGAGHNHLVGENVEMGIASGASVNYRAGFRAQTFDTGHGVISDAAFTVFGTGSSPGWLDLILLNEWTGTQSIATTGSLIRSHSALTITNAFKLDNVTITGDILHTPHAKLTGTGALTLNLTDTAAIAPPTGTHWHFVSTGTAGLTLDAYNGGESGIHLRAANNVIGSPAALGADDLIGVVNFIGHTGSAYTTTGRAAIFGHASENWNASTNQGAYIDFYTTPTGSATRARTVRMTPAGGIAIGHATDVAAGSVHGNGNFIANGFMASGGTGVGTGQYRIGGNSSGAVTLTAHAAAGTPTVTFGTNSGTPAVMASPPLSINTTTGDISITGSSLTRTNDTNVTLTLGGSPTTALLAATSLTMGWTGTLAVVRGGTGLSSIVTGDVLYASGTNTLSALSAVAVGAVLVSNGTNTAPIWDTTPYISGSVAIGANTALNSGVLLQLNANTVVLPTPTFSGTAFQFGGADAGPVRAYMDAFSDTFSHSGTYVFRRHRGTAASRGAVLSGNHLGAFFFDGFDGTGYNASDAPAIVGVASENFAVGSHGSGFQFRPVPNGGLASVLAMTLHNTGGVVLSTATGGDKGLGTLNAIGVYDDNTLLTCYPFEVVRKGRIKVEEWDARVPNRLRFKRVPGAGGEMTDVPDGEELRLHDPLRKFMARLDTEYDPIRLDSYIKHWEDKGHLTSMPNEAKFDPEKGMPVGAWMQRVVETVELQAIHDRELRDAIRVLAERVSALEPQH
jgi:hypothetical protein